MPKPSQYQPDRDSVEYVPSDPVAYYEQARAYAAKMKAAHAALDGLGSPVAAFNAVAAHRPFENA